MNKSFTLIELLIVIAIIAIIAGAVLVAINPAKRLAQANDSRRYSEVSSILTAVNTYIVDNRGSVPSCDGSFALPADGVYRWLGTSGTKVDAKNYTGGGEPNCIAAYLMDVEGDVSDACGANNGTLNGDPTWIEFQSSPAFGAYNFDGNGDYVNVLDPGASPLDITDAITITTWVRPAVEPAIDPGVNELNQYPIAKMNAYFLDSTRDFDALPHFYLRIDGLWRAIDTWPISLNANQWYHLAGTYDSNEKIMRIYLNGVEKGVFDLGSLGSYTIETSDNDLRVGLYSSNYYFDGIIDEVAVFDRALTADEIKEIYLYGLTGIWPNCDLEADLTTIGGYLSKIPEDPTNGDLDGIGNSGYMIKRDPTGTISVKAPHASDYAEQEIMVSR